MMRLKICATFCALAFLLASCASYNVYSVKSRPNMAVKGGLMYALPQTDICLSVTFQKRNFTQAPYAQFASEMLGMDSLRIDEPYSIVSMSLSGVNKADPSQYYFISPRRISVNVDSRGLLQSVGMNTPVSNRAGLGEGDFSYTEPSAEHAPSLSLNTYDRADTFYVRGDLPGHPSLVSTRKDVRNLRQRAQAAADRIAELQEKRQQLLYGDYDGNYTPEAIQYLVDRLGEQESALLSQFLGTTETETVDFYITPSSDRSKVAEQQMLVFCFSPTFGLYDTIYPEVPDLCPFYCTITSEANLKKPSGFVRATSKGLIGKNNTTVGRSTFKYRQSEVANVRIEGGKYSFSRQLPIAQFGPIIDLPRGRFRAVFDRHTGDLIYFER